MRIGFVLSQPAPYRDGIIESMHQNGLDIDVWYLHDTRWYHTEWNYSSPLKNVFYPTTENKNTFWGELNKDFVRRINDADYDVLIVNGIYPMTAMQILIHRIIKNKPYIILADTVEQNGPYVIRKYIYKHAKALFVAGKKSKQFFESIGVSRDKIHIGCYVYNNREIFEIIEEARKERNERREKLGMSNEVFWYLFVGKLIPNRKIKNLLEAHKKCEDKVGLLIIGNGPDYGELNEYMRTHKNIISIEQVPVQELHEYYAIVDGYVHPGKEPYSLSEIEAAISGIPIVTTNQVGAYLDVVCPGENGEILELDDIDALEQALVSIASGKFSKEKCSEMQEMILDTHEPDVIAEKFIKVIGDIK